MPAIPQYHQQISASGSLGPGAESVAAPVTSGVSILADGLSSLVDDQNRLKRFAQERQNANDIVAANGVATQMQSDWLQNLQKAKQEAAPGADGFTSNVSAAFDKDAEQRLKAVTNPRAQRYLQEHINRMRLSLQQDAMQFEAQSRIANQQATLQTSIDSARNAAIFRPDDFARLADEQSVAINASSLDAPTKQKLQMVSRQSIAAASVYSYIDRNPRAALAELKNEKSANPAFQALDSEDRQAFINTAEVKVRQLENQAESDANKREAAAEREVNTIQKNIASGVPITAQMWTESGKVLNGTSLASQLKQLQDQEIKVQNVLRQPIATQQAFVQQATAELDSNGGDSNDRTSLKMLRDTIQQNINTIQKTPLLFLQNRTGQQVQQLDLNGLVSGDEAAQKQIEDRVIAIQAGKKQFGSQMPMRPLLPQEVAVLSDAIVKSSPKDQATIFAGINKSVNADPAVYNGIMQQIAPDAPVIAAAGALAAKDAQLTTTHWFKPDQQMPSTKVAETILTGYELLHPNAEQKKSDGNPKKALFLPQDTLLQDAFVNEVGKAFAGRSDVAQSAFEAVKAYYAGKSDQGGDMAKSKADVNTTLVKEAVHNVLGNVVDYNGKGKVLAPWGMDASTFRDRAQVLVDQALTQYGYAPYTVHQIALENDRGDNYLMKVGESYLLDPRTHQPIVINVANPIAVKHQTRAGTTIEMK